MNREENGLTGRVLAHVATGAEAGTTYELTAMKQASWENVLTNPFAQDRTVLIGLDDTHQKAQDRSKYKPEAGKLYVYIGHKQKIGNEIEKAGLLNGQSYAVRVGKGGLKRRFDSLSGRFDLIRDGATNFLRPERWALGCEEPERVLFRDHRPPDVAQGCRWGRGDHVFTN